MSQITNDLANVISHTRKILPTPDIDDEEDNPHSPFLKHNTNTPPVVQYSARHLHVVQRTYDSTDDEADDFDVEHDDNDRDHSLRDGEVPTVDVDDLDVPDVPDVPNITEMRQESYVDAAELRRTMMEDAGASTDTVITVEGRPGVDRALRASLGGLGTKLKDKLKDKPGKATEDDKEQLTLELSRLGREVRRLKRIPHRSKHEQKKLEEMQAKAAKISDKLGHAPPEEGGPSPGEEDGSGTEMSPTAASGKTPKEDAMKAKKSAIFGGRPPKPERRTSAVPTATDTHISRDYGLTEEEMEFDKMEEASPQASRQNLGTRTPSSKRKKGWFALEAGVASIKALGRTVRTGLAAKGDADGKQSAGSNPTSPVGNKPPAYSNSKAKSPNADAGGGGNAFAEAAAKVKQRGEKLGSAAEGSEQMANDAGDMLAAVRALRQRNKGGLFS